MLQSLTKGSLLGVKNLELEAVGLKPYSHWPKGILRKWCQGWDNRSPWHPDGHFRNLLLVWGHRSYPLPVARLRVTPLTPSLSQGRTLIACPKVKLPWACLKVIGLPRLWPSHKVTHTPHLGLVWRSYPSHWVVWRSYPSPWAGLKVIPLTLSWSEGHTPHPELVWRSYPSHWAGLKVIPLTLSSSEGHTPHIELIWRSYPSPWAGLKVIPLTLSSSQSHRPQTGVGGVFSPAQSADRWSDLGRGGGLLNIVDTVQGDYKGKNWQGQVQTTGQTESGGKGRHVCVTWFRNPAKCHASKLQRRATVLSLRA